MSRSRRRTVRITALCLAATSIVCSRRARADEPEVPADLGRLIFDDGRPTPPAPDPDNIHFTLHGEAQLRYQRQSFIALTPTATRSQEIPGLVQDSLGQRNHVRDWVRLKPKMTYLDLFELRGEVEVSGMPAGERSRNVDTDLSPRFERGVFDDIRPRALVIQFHTRYGDLTSGLMPVHWGLGIVQNDGDHPSLFGDYRYGSIHDRIGFVTAPIGGSPLVLGIHGDLVHSDGATRLVRGDEAMEGGLFARYGREDSRHIGLLAQVRSQTNPHENTSAFFSTTTSETNLLLDLTGRYAARAPGADDTFVFAAGELAMNFGTAERNRLNANGSPQSTTVRSVGGAGRVGVVHRGKASSRLDRDLVRYGCFVGQLELGYASADADPYDAVDRRFTFSENYKVGLVLFDEVMRWQTARAANAIRDPRVRDATRPFPGVERLPSNGGVFGARYLNPTVVVRPRQWLDLKAGAIIAEASDDVVDPYRLMVGGIPGNYRGGDISNHDLGIELDGGFEARFPLVRDDLSLAAGVQAGILFPGGAMADERGTGYARPWLTIARLGLVY